jgi:hypothetical protein
MNVRIVSKLVDVYSLHPPRLLSLLKNLKRDEE